MLPIVRVFLGMYPLAGGKSHHVKAGKFFLFRTSRHKIITSHHIITSAVRFSKFSHHYHYQVYLRWL